MIDFTLNGQARGLDLSAHYPLLDALRHHLGLHSPRLGCGLEQCGACHVLVDGVSVPTCASSVDRIAGKAVTTLECTQTPHPTDDARWPHILGALQDAFVQEEAAQCGYCTNGLLISAAALLARVPTPSDAQVREALQGHLCRCGAHLRVLRAVARAARTLNEAQP